MAKDKVWSVHKRKHKQLGLTILLVPPSLRIIVFNLGNLDNSGTLRNIEIEYIRQTGGIFFSSASFPLTRVLRNCIVAGHLLSILI